MQIWASLLDQAEAARRAGEGGAALDLVRRASDAAPEQPGPCFLLCLVLLERRDPEANAVLVRLERFPSYAPGWERLGHGLAALHPAAARVAFERAAKAYQTGDDTADVAHRLGVVRRQLGDAAGARAALELAVARDPAHAAAWFLLGLLRQDNHEPVAAAEAFRASLAARPDHHEAEFNLAVALQEAGNMEAALDHYARAWRLRPDSFGRVAQALVSPAIGRLWLQPGALMRDLAARL
jgi:tetratricopeptide (TPR) repeat protein